MPCLYAVEVIIDTKGKPYLVEINGCDTGIGQFEDAGGGIVTFNLLKKMQHLAHGKPIYSEYYKPSDATKKAQSGIEEIVVNSYTKMFQTSPRWRFGLEQLPKGTSGSVRALARRLCIEYIPFDEYSAHTKTVTFRRDGFSYRVPKDDIGLIWLDVNKYGFLGKSGFDEVLVNPSSVEKIVDNKAYVHRLLSQTNLRSHLPLTRFVGWGLGYSLPQYQGYCVFKPSAGRHGRNVCIGYHKDIAELIKEYDEGDDVHAGMKRSFRKLSAEPRACLVSYWLEPNLYLTQRFIASKKFDAGRVKRPCIFRTLVFDKHALAVAQQFQVAYGKIGTFLSVTPPDRLQRAAGNFSEEIIDALENRIKEEGITTKGGLDAFRTEFWRKNLDV